MYPMVIVALAAAVVASQARISGAFSLTRQAVQLGDTPRVTVVHTSHHEAGQIYVPEVNQILMVACIALVLGFQSTSGLAGAYGIAVTGTMTMTTILFANVARVRLGWSPAPGRAAGGAVSPGRPRVSGSEPPVRRPPSSDCRPTG